MDQSRVGHIHSRWQNLPYMSKRFALKRYLGLTEEEMARNAELWAEENNVPQKKQSKSNELRGGGVTQSGISSDLDQFEEPTADPDAPEPGSTRTRSSQDRHQVVKHQAVQVAVDRYKVKYDYETK